MYTVNWSQWNSNELFKERFDRLVRKSQKRFTPTRQAVYVCAATVAVEKQ